MRHLIASFLIIALAGCAAPALTASAPRASGMATKADDAPPVIAQILGDGRPAATFATWLGRKIKLSVAATGKGLRYKWTSDGTLEGRTDGAEAVFVGAEWGDFTATVSVFDAKGRAASKTVKIAVWPGAR